MRSVALEWVGVAMGECAWALGVSKDVGMRPVESLTVSGMSWDSAISNFFLSIPSLSPQLQKHILTTRWYCTLICQISSRCILTQHCLLTKMWNMLTQCWPLLTVDVSLTPNSHVYKEGLWRARPPSVDSLQSYVFILSWVCSLQELTIVK